MNSHFKATMILLVKRSPFKLVKLTTLLCDVDSLIRGVGAVLIGWQKNIVTNKLYFGFLTKNVPKVCFKTFVT